MSRSGAVAPVATTAVTALGGRAVITGLVVARCGDAGEDAVCGHPEVETVQHRLFPSEYLRDHVPFRAMPVVTGHAVRMLGSRHNNEAIGDGYELPSKRAYAETCAAIGTMRWAWRMFVGTGGARRGFPRTEPPSSTTTRCSAGRTTTSARARGSDIDDLVLDYRDAASARVTPGPASLPDSLVIEVTARQMPPASELYPEFLEEDPVRDQARRVTLIPYFLWGNREPGPMRVWIRRS